MTISTPQSVSPPVLVPGSHEEAGQGHRHQTEHDAAEQRFNHGDNKNSFSFHHPMGEALVVSPLNQP